MYYFQKNIFVIFAFILIGATRVYSQSIDECMLKSIISKNEQVLGLYDSSLKNQTKQIRVFNISNGTIDPSLLKSINPLNSMYNIRYKDDYFINMVLNKQLEKDINTGRYRDLFIISIESSCDSIIKLATIAFKYKPNDGVSQTEILGEFEFLKRNSCNKLKSFHLGAVD